MEPFASTRKLIGLLRARGLKPRVALVAGAHPTRAAEIAELLRGTFELRPKAARRAVERREPLSLGEDLHRATQLAIALRRAGGYAELVHERCELFAHQPGGEADLGHCEWLIIGGRSVYLAQGRPWDWGAMRALVSEGPGQVVADAIDEQRGRWAEQGMVELGSELELCLARCPREAELEASLAAAPEAAFDEVAAVYADWLLSRGDPRGEVGVAGLQAGGAELAERLRERHALHLLGPLDRGLAPDSLRWRGPVIVAAQPRLRAPEQDGEHALQLLLSLPASACMRELELRASDIPLGELGSTLELAPARASLRRLSVAAAGPVKLRGAFPELEQLQVEGASGSSRLDQLDTPALRRLSLQLLMPRLPLVRPLSELFEVVIEDDEAAMPGSLLGLHAPALEQLVLSLEGHESWEFAYGDLFTQLREALTRERLPKLRSLSLSAITTRPYAGALRHLARLPCLETLERLDLRGVRMSREARRELEAALRPKLRELLLD